MIRTIRTTDVVLLLAGAAAVIGAGCSPADGETGDAQNTASDGSTRVINVEVAPVRAQSFTEYIRVTGEVEALEEVTLSAQEAGVIERFLAEKGDRVRRNQPIAMLDAAVLRAQVDEARAQAQLAREQFERQRVLWEEERIGTELAYLQAKYQAESAAARLATLEARLERMVIRSPVDGVFDAKFLEAGEMAAPGTPLAHVMTLSRVKVTAGVPERFATAVRRGSQARITFDMLPDREFEGRISFVGSSVDAASRTFPIEVVIPNPRRVIKPRLVANVQVVRADLDSAIVVPQHVIMRTTEGYQVFVAVDQDGRTIARARPVRLGASHANRVVVDSGLEIGERLITVGAQQVSDQTPVRIVGDAPPDGHEAPEETP